MCGHQKHKQGASFSGAVSLSLYISEAPAPHSVGPFSLFLSFIPVLLFICPSCLVFGFGLSVCVCVFPSGHDGGVVCYMGVSCCGGRVGYASRRAMLQQFHGVTMYSHDEHPTSAPYCWSERGKGASAAHPSTAVLLSTRPSRQVPLSVRPVALSIGRPRMAYSCPEV